MPDEGLGIGRIFWKLQENESVGAKERRCIGKTFGRSIVTASWSVLKHSELSWRKLIFVGLNTSKLYFLSLSEPEKRLLQ